MDYYVCAVGKMWVAKHDGQPPNDVGSITGVHKVVLTDDKSEALKFKDWNNAKSLANKTGGEVWAGA